MPSRPRGNVTATASTMIPYRTILKSPANRSRSGNIVRTTAPMTGPTKRSDPPTATKKSEIVGAHGRNVSRIHAATDPGDGRAERKHADLHGNDIDAGARRRRLV